MRKVVTTVKKVAKKAKTPIHEPLREEGWVFVGRYKDQDLYARSNPPETKRVDGLHIYWAVSVTSKLDSASMVYNKAHAAARRLAHKMGLEGF